MAQVRRSLQRLLALRRLMCCGDGQWASDGNFCLRGCRGRLAAATYRTLVDLVAGGVGDGGGVSCLVGVIARERRGNWWLLLL